MWMGPHRLSLLLRLPSSTSPCMGPHRPSPPDTAAGHHRIHPAWVRTDLPLTLRLAIIKFTLCTVMNSREGGLQSKDRTGDVGTGDPTRVKLITPGMGPHRP